MNTVLRVFFVSRKIKATDYKADAESKPTVGVDVSREQSENVNQLAVDSADRRNKPVRQYVMGSWGSTSNEFSPSGFFVGKKNRVKYSDNDAPKSESSVGCCGDDNGDEAESSPVNDVSEGVKVSDSSADDENVAVAAEQSEECQEKSEKRVLCLKRKATVSRDFPPKKRKMVSAKREFPIGCEVGTSGAVKEDAKEKGTADVGVGGGRQIVSALMAPRVFPWRNSKGRLKKRCFSKH
ncbi:hypothetical protein RND81_13G104400 [Saponaria officinalis]|uniref:Uncharacterized protein n=1 Tax=Saponaria officinalis TaxID=3572 RepID=A0AAW1GY86_SAPOF